MLGIIVPTDVKTFLTIPRSDYVGCWASDPYNKFGKLSALCDLACFAIVVGGLRHLPLRVLIRSCSLLSPLGIEYVPLKTAPEDNPDAGISVPKNLGAWLPVCAVRGSVTGRVTFR